MERCAWGTGGWAGESRVLGTTSYGFAFLCKEEACHSGFVHRRSKPLKMSSQQFTPNTNVFAFTITVSIVRRAIKTICASKSSIPSTLQKRQSDLFWRCISQRNWAGSLVLVQAAVKNYRRPGGLQTTEMHFSQLCGWKSKVTMPATVGTLHWFRWQASFCVTWQGENEGALCPLT